MKEVILVFVGGGLRSVIRFVMGRWINAFHTHHFPWGTLAVNVVACFIMGITPALGNEKFGWKVFTLRRHGLWLVACS